MIIFGVHAPDEATFWQSWVEAGIVEIVDGKRRLKAPYAGNMDTTADSWGGIITKDGEVVPGWHCNVRVWGDLEQQFIFGLAQADEAGALLSIWQRTHAATFFGLTLQAADETTGFPAGYRSAAGVTYADTADFSSPSNVWA